MPMLAFAELAGPSLEVLAYLALSELGVLSVTMGVAATIACEFATRLVVFFSILLMHERIRCGYCSMSPLNTKNTSILLLYINDLRKLLDFNLAISIHVIDIDRCCSKLIWLRGRKIAMKKFWTLCTFSV